MFGGEFNPFRKKAEKAQVVKTTPDAALDQGEVALAEGALKKEVRYMPDGTITAPMSDEEFQKELADYRDRAN